VRDTELLAELARRGHVDADWAKTVMRRFLLPVYRWESAPEPAASLLKAAADDVRGRGAAYRRPRGRGGGCLERRP
jgi:hypothetical protein